MDVSALENVDLNTVNNASEQKVAITSDSRAAVSAMPQKACPHDERVENKFNRVANGTKIKDCIHQTKMDPSSH